MDWVVRGIILLWAAFFGWMGLTGLADPHVYVQQFGIAGDAAALNTVRSDFSAFFLIAAGAAAWGVLRPEHRLLLLLPAALFGTALLGRFIGLMLGDPAAPVVTQSMMAEGISVLLLAGAWRWLAHRHGGAATAATLH